MSFYRIKQFMWAMNTHMSFNEVQYTKEKLTVEEQSIFETLAKNEQKHCIRVCKAVEAELKLKKEENNILLKAALLHDVGKSKKKINIIFKAIIVVLDKITKGKIKKYTNIVYVNIYYNHDKLGAEILKGINCDKRIVYLVGNHHNTKIKTDEELNLIRYFDNKN